MDATTLRVVTPGLARDRCTGPVGVDKADHQFAARQPAAGGLGPGPSRAGIANIPVRTVVGHPS
jgi:hypothetical protein